MLGARGNSGVILSQLIRGAAEELASRPGELVDPVLIGAALARAADQAYGSVREPAEGHDPDRRARDGPPSRLRAGPHPRRAARPRRDDVIEQDEVIAHVIEQALDAGQESVRRGPDLLPVLRDAGVVDAGGYAVTVLLAGIVGALRGGEAPVVEHHAAARVSHPQHSSTTYRYCTNFAVSGTALEQRQFISELEQIGDSVLVVGDATTLKVHVHTDDPDAATALFVGRRRRLAPRRGRHERAGTGARRAPGGARAGGLRGARGGQRQRHARAVRGLRRTRARRRSDAESVDL